VPQSDSLQTLLWNAHRTLAFIFFALILLHLVAGLFHALVRRDGVSQSMTAGSTRDGDAVTAMEIWVNNVGIGSP
jgi:cytochrome b561